MRRALLLANSKARNGRDARELIGPALEKHGISVIQTSEQDPSHFRELIERFRNNVDLVIAAGGDGTCLCVADVLRGGSLPMGVIPLGTANNLARSLGIPFSLEDAVAVIAGGNTRAVDMALVNEKPFLNVSGMGLSTQVNRHVPDELKKRWGVIAYAIYLFKVTRRTRPFKAEITCDGKTTRVRSLQITICNGRHYGAGMTIVEDAEIDDGRLDLLSTNLAWWRGILFLPRMMSGRYKWKPGVKVLSGKVFEIKTDPRMPLDTDGEVTTKTPARYEILEGALKVFAPKRDC